MTEMTDQAKRAVPDRASRTALSAAMMRAMASRDAAPAFPGQDPLAWHFLPPNVKTVLLFPFFRKLLRKKFVGGYEYLYARTAHYDRLFSEALSEGTPQIVLLGSGYDTRALRFSGQLGSTRVYELDSAAIHEAKRVCLRKAGYISPANIVPVPVDFERDSLVKVLLEAGYDPDRRGLFIWEGVTPYLSEEAIRSTLIMIRDNAPPGTILGFDYAYQAAIDGRVAYYGARETAMAVSEDREPFRFGFDEGEVGPFLTDLGYRILAHYSPDDLESAYLVSAGGDLMGQMYGFMCNVVAEITV